MPINNPNYNIPTISATWHLSAAVVITWTAPPITPDHYKLYRGVTNVWSAATVVSTFAGSALTVSDTPTANGTLYYYWVIGWNADGSQGGYNLGVEVSKNSVTITSQDVSGLAAVTVAFPFPTVNLNGTLEGRTTLSLSSWTSGIPYDGADPVYAQAYIEDPGPHLQLFDLTSVSVTAGGGGSGDTGVATRPILGSLGALILSEGAGGPGSQWGTAFGYAVGHDFTATSTMSFYGLGVYGGPTDSPLFSVGDVITTNCVKVIITAVNVDGTFSGTVIGTLDSIPNSPSEPVPIKAGSWVKTTPQQIITGLGHLEGLPVWALADGKVVGPLTVLSGQVDLNFSASSWVVGLQYTSEFKSLRLDVGDPTIQGRRKVIPAVTLRTKCAVGYTVGTSEFIDMYQPKTEYGEYTQYTPGGTLPAAIPFTGDVRVNVEAGWETNGVITIQQTLPLPVTILGLIPEITLGDTQR